MRSSWQCLNGANNRLDSLAWIQEPQFSLYAPKECLLSLSHMYNEFLFCGLHEMVKFCSKSIIFWSSCFAFLVWGHSRDRKAFPKIENWLQEQAFSVLWIMNVFNLPNPPSSSPSLSLQALCYSCWCLNVLLCRSYEYLIGVSSMRGFTLLQQVLTHANSPRLHITPCYFDLGHKYIFVSNVQTAKPQKHFSLKNKTV